MGLPLRLPRDRLELRVGVVRRPTALGSERRPTSASTTAAARASFTPRARELERRGRPGPLATATIQAPRGLEASVPSPRVKPDLFCLARPPRLQKKEPELP